MVWGSLLRSTGLPAATIGSTSRPQQSRPRPPRLSASVAAASVAFASQLRRGVKAKNKEDTLVVEGRMWGWNTDQLFGEYNHASIRIPIKQPS